MYKVFIGMFFILLDFNVRFAQTHVFSLLPSFVGYLLIAFGLKSVADKNVYFDMGRRLSWVMFVLTLISYISNAAALSYMFQMPALVLSIMVVLGTIVDTYLIVRGCSDEEYETGISWNAGKLTKFWMFYAVFTLLQNAVLLLIPVAEVYMIVAVVLLVTVREYMSEKDIYSFFARYARQVEEIFPYPPRYARRAP